MFVEIGVDRYITLDNVQSMSVNQNVVVFYCNHSFLRNPNQGYRSMQALFQIHSDKFRSEDDAVEWLRKHVDASWRGSPPESYF